MHIQKVLTDLIDKLERWGHALFLLLPNIILAIMLVVFFWLLAKVIDRTLRKVLQRFSVGHEVIDLTAVIVFVVIFRSGAHRCNRRSYSRTMINDIAALRIN